MKPGYKAWFSSPPWGVIRCTLQPILGVPLWEETERLISMKMTL
jgi:hypothetical protein